MFLMLAFVLTDKLLVLSGYSLLKTTERAPRHVGKSYSRRTQKVVNECTTYFVRGGGVRQIVNHRGVVG